MWSVVSTDAASATGLYGPPDINGKVKEMRKNLVIAELKTSEEADKTVMELDSGKVRPSASGLVRNASL